MDASKKQDSRVVVAYWKNNPGSPIEVFSSLKNFCLNYPTYSYNTLNNYLGKKRIPFENLHVRVERKAILGKPEIPMTQHRQMVPVLRRTSLKEANDDERDMVYWLTKTPQERLAALTALVSESLSPGQRMDRSIFSQRKIK